MIDGSGKKRTRSVSPRKGSLEVPSSRGPFLFLGGERLPIFQRRPHAAHERKVTVEDVRTGSVIETLKALSWSLSSGVFGARAAPATSSCYEVANINRARVTSLILHLESQTGVNTVKRS